MLKENFFNEVDLIESQIFVVIIFCCHHFKNIFVVMDSIDDLSNIYKSRNFSCVIHMLLSYSYFFSMIIYFAFLNLLQSQFIIVNQSLCRRNIETF